MSATDDYAHVAPGLSSPARHAAVVTPSDGVDLANVSRALYVATGGALKLTTIGGETITFTVGDNVLLPLRATRVWATGTDADDILALY